MPIDRDVVGRISKYHPRALLPHEFRAARWIARVRAKELMLSKQPSIARLRDGFRLNRRHLVQGVVLNVLRPIDQ
jgi:hypothetical protein